jgi:hypothetical protein
MTEVLEEISEGNVQSNTSDGDNSVYSRGSANIFDSVQYSREHTAVPSLEADFALNLLSPVTEEGKMLADEGSSLCSA